MGKVGVAVADPKAREYDFLRDERFEEEDQVTGIFLVPGWRIYSLDKD